MRDLHSNVKAVEALRAATRTADVNGADVNLAGYEACEFVASIGQSGDTLSGSVYATIEMEEADDNGSGSAGSYTDVAAADIIGGNGATTNGEAVRIDATTEDRQVYRFGYIGQKKFVRVVYNVTGTHTNGTPVAICAVLGKPRHAPVANQTA